MTTSTLVKIMSEYTCIRCGRDTGPEFGHSKIELHRFFDQDRDGHNPVFFVLCRFYSEDFEAWIHGNDPGALKYRDVDDWLIPEEQKSEYFGRPMSEHKTAETVRWSNG